MAEIPFEAGYRKTWAKTVSECDVYLFGGVTGDLARNHFNEQYMKTTPFGARIAHGLLSLCLSGACATTVAEASSVPCVSYGYDKIRFIKPVFIGDTLTVVYTIETLDRENGKTFAKVEVSNQKGELCTVGVHILKFMD